MPWKKRDETRTSLWLGNKSTFSSHQQRVAGGCPRAEARFPSCNEITTTSKQPRSSLLVSLYCKERNHIPPTVYSNSKANQHLLCNQNHSEQRATQGCKTNSVVSIISLHSTITGFSTHSFFIQTVIFPGLHVSHYTVPPRLKISGFSWTWKDFF